VKRRDDSRLQETEQCFAVPDGTVRESIVMEVIRWILGEFKLIARCAGGIPKNTANRTGQLDGAVQTLNHQSRAFDMCGSTAACLAGPAGESTIKISCHHGRKR